MIQYKTISVIFILNSKNELALQLRAGKDDSFPLHWDFSVGGSIDEGEDPLTAAKREAKEELGIDINPEFIAEDNLTYKAWDPSITREEHVFIFKTIYNGEFHPNSEEVEKVDFFSLEKIREMIKNGEKFHPGFLLVWNKGLLN